MKENEVTNVTMQIDWEVEQIKKFFENRQKSLEKIDSIMKLEKVQKVIEQATESLESKENVVETIKEAFKLNLETLVLGQVIIKFVTEKEPLSDEVVADMITDELVDEALETVKEVVLFSLLRSAFEEVFFQ